MERSKRIVVTTDASGAQQAAREGLVVVIVDVIDMSTTLESALDAGAYAVLGASPDLTRAPVALDPERIGKESARLARENDSGIILVSEPRVGTDKERLARCRKVIRGIEQERGIVEAILPNIGAEIPKMVTMRNRVVVAVTDTGGVAYDAAFMESPQVTIGTVARTYGLRGLDPARQVVRRVEGMIREEDRGVAVVAASRNSMEDVLAAQFIANLLMAEKEAI
ncbi:hypothetical protein [Syntrophomonas erecta]